jgi:uncharacterized repeat protein (TIGR02543 family)
LNGGEGTAPAKQTVKEGGKATQPANPARTSYRFDGWYTQATGGAKWDFAENAVTGYTALYARWTLVWTVTFNPNGGTSGGIPSQIIPNGEKATEPANPVWTSHRFDGWHTAVTGGAMWNFATGTVTENLALYARWTPFWTVTLVLNGGYIDPYFAPAGYVSRSGNVFIVEHNARFQPEWAAKDGLNFSGWFSDEALTKRETNTAFGSMDFYVTVTSDMMLYAKYF